MNAPIRTQTHHSDDEISLVDLWLVLVRHTKPMVTIFVFILIAALAIAYIKPAVYTYSASIEIGSIDEQGPGESRKLIDNPTTLLAKINEGYIPLVQQELGRTPFDVTAKVPKGSTLIVLEARAAEEDGEAVQQFERRIIELVRADHARMLDLEKAALNDVLADEQRNLAEQLDTQKVVQARLESNKTLVTLLEKQLAEANVQLSDINMSRKKARGLSVNESKAMTMLMLSSELELNRQRIAALEERLQVQLPTENKQLMKALADSARQQDSIRASIEQLQLKLRNIQETRAIVEPSRSVVPVGPGMLVIVLLGVVLGVLLAIFSVFVLEMVARARVELTGRRQ